MKKMLTAGAGLLIFLAVLGAEAIAQEDRIVKAAIDTVRAQLRFPPETEIKVEEKRESPLPDFYSVKLLLLAPDKEIPVVVYVDKTAEKVILGNLFIRGENVTTREAGPARPKKVEMAGLDMDRSPSIGSAGARVTVVEFSHFQCPYCMDAWQKLKEQIEKKPKEIRYVFKHFPFQSKGKAFELSELAAAAQEAGNEAFWTVHDFLFTNEGQALAKQDREVIRRKIEELLKEKGLNLKAFQSALESGRARKRVEEDMTLGAKLRITATPTKVINGDVVVGSPPGNPLERYLVK